MDMPLNEYHPSAYTLELLANQYKQADIQIEEPKELVSDAEVCTFLKKTMPTLYLGFFILVVVLSGVFR